MPDDLGPQAGSSTAITVVTAVDPVTIERFWHIYVAAFEPLVTKAAARHMLTFDEFAAEMTDDRIDKYVATANDGYIYGITTVTTDLSAVPWIEPDFYLSRYPEQAARGALFYLGFTLVDPSRRPFRVFKDMMDTVCRRFAAARGVCGMDFCDHNARGAVGKVVRALPTTFGATIEEVDTQFYKALDFSMTNRSGLPSEQQLDAQHYYVADFRNAPAPDPAHAAPVPTRP
jgi:hypothetical protein